MPTLLAKVCSFRVLIIVLMIITNLKLAKYIHANYASVGNRTSIIYIISCILIPVSMLN